MVHFYDEIGPAELHRILTEQRGDVEAVLSALSSWLDRVPERVDDGL